MDSEEDDFYSGEAMDDDNDYYNSDDAAADYGVEDDEDDDDGYGFIEEDPDHDDFDNASFRRQQVYILLNFSCSSSFLIYISFGIFCLVIKAVSFFHFLCSLFGSCFELWRNCCTWWCLFGLIEWG